MSISGLSNHLCFVVAVITSLHVVNTQSYDFTNSRQFKKNLAVSKYRNNTHWLPNYTWKPPEKFYGPRKKPAWEVNEPTESKADKVKREEREKWEKKMREVTRRRREKWKTWEKKKPTQANVDGQTATSPADDSVPGAGTSVPKEFPRRLKDPADGPAPLNNNLENGRWGMAARDPVSEGIFSDSPTAFAGDPPGAKHEVTTRGATNGRWGMSIKEAPKAFLEEMAAKSEVQRSNGSLNAGEDPTKDDKNDSNPKSRNRSSDGSSDVPGRTTGSSSIEETAPATFPPGRWGMGVKEPPEEFLKEIARRSETFKIPSEASERDEDRARAENKNIDDAEEDPEERRNTETQGASTKLPNDLPNARRRMSQSFPSGEFLGEISRHDHPGIEGFYKPWTFPQFVGDRASINVPLPRKLSVFRTSSTPNVLVLQSFPGIIGVPILPGYFIDPRILTKYNQLILRCITC